MVRLGRREKKETWWINPKGLVLAEKGKQKFQGDDTLLVFLAKTEKMNSITWGGGQEGTTRLLKRCWKS